MLSGRDSPVTSEKDPFVPSRSAANAVPFGPKNEFFPWRHRFAVFTALATFVLIFVGGLVTSTGSSLSVPDWPLSYGQLFPPMVGGIFYEHGHRMVAGTVALLTAGLAFWTWREEPRSTVRRLAALALGTVLLQAVLGGVTVLLRLPTAVSVAHAALAQAIFCLVVALALVTGRSWLGAPAPRPDGILDWLTAATTAAIYLQLLLGAVMRHTGAGLAIPDFPLAFGRVVPEITSFTVGIHFAHRVGAAIVSVLVLATAARIAVAYRDDPGWLLLSLLLVLLLVVQVTLGASIVWTRKAVLPTTAHVAIGAALLGASLVAALRCRRSGAVSELWIAEPIAERAPA
jgi:cytochrome c oxidase assembly protein subunit 15